MDAFKFWAKLCKKYKNIFINTNTTILHYPAVNLTFSWTNNSSHRFLWIIQTFRCWNKKNNEDNFININSEQSYRIFEIVKLNITWNIAHLKNILEDILNEWTLIFPVETGLGILCKTLNRKRYPKITKMKNKNKWKI